jgi:hypothetical protein
MPRRTAKISRNKSGTEDSEMEIEPVVDDNPQEESENESENMLDLENLKDLIFLGRLSETVDISGYRFVITTLSTKQQRDIMQTVMKVDQVERLLDIKPITVSKVIESINGVPLEDLCTDDDLEGVAERRLDVVYNLQTNVIEKVYQVYEKLVLSSNEELGLDFLKE